jgi:hypothetical protein
MTIRFGLINRRNKNYTAYRTNVETVFFFFLFYFILFYSDYQLPKVGKQQSEILSTTIHEFIFHP